MKNRKIGTLITTAILLLICISLAIAIIIKIFQPEEEIQFMQGGNTEIQSESNVYTQNIDLGDFTKVVTLYGTVEDDSDELAIITRTSGYVSEILVTEDERVEEGQIIGYIDPSSPGASYQKSPIIARVSGTIESIDVVVGEYVSSGSVFATEKEMSGYIINVNVPERYLDNIYKGSSAYISSTIRTSIDTEAYVTDIANKIDSTTRTITVELTPEDKTGLLDGLVVTIDLVIEQESDVISIPTDAIFVIGNRNYVYVVDNGIAVRREVELGSQNDSDTVILSGLSIGDSVIVSGSVTEGASVNILER